MVKDVEDRELDETLYEQDADEVERSHRAMRGDFVGDPIEEDDEETDDTEESNEEEEDSDDLEDEESTDDDSEDDEDSEVEEEEESNKIPRSRLNEVIEQREEYKDRIFQLEELVEKLVNGTVSKKEEETKEEEIDPYDFDLAEQKYIELILEGDTDTAFKLRKEINEERAMLFSKEIDSVRKYADDVSTKKSNSALEEEKFDNLVASFEDQYPFLNNESDDYNEEAIDTVNTLMVGFMEEKNMTKSQALSQAIKKILPLYSKTIKETKPSLGKKRKASAKEKAVDTAKKQPSKPSNSLKERKESLTDIKVSDMSEREYGKLTAKEKAILRGDVLG